MIDFIGIGAQRSGTSWVYACLYEHPQICIPIKEIHFFSRERFKEGKEWYEGHFARCKEGMILGEFSTSYLYTPGTAARMHAMYPNAKIIAILRNPIDRAFSQYGNARKGGEIPESMTFEEYYTTDKSVLEQGLYAAQLEVYLAQYARNQILLSVYEDNKNPKDFIQRIYAFLGVDAGFVPSMLHDEINISRMPRSIELEKNMHYFSEFLRKYGLDKVVHLVRRSGLPELVRTLNTKEKKKEKPAFDRARLAAYFKDDVAKLGVILGRDMGKEWNIE